MTMPVNEIRVELPLTIIRGPIAELLLHGGDGQQHGYPLISAFTDIQERL
jgi:hypothetical protein